MSDPHRSTPPDLVADAHRALARADKLLKVSEAAALSGIPKRTIWRWIRKGAIPSERSWPTCRIRLRESVVARLADTA